MREDSRTRRFSIAEDSLKTRSTSVSVHSFGKQTQEDSGIVFAQNDAQNLQRAKSEDFNRFDN